MYLGTCRVAGLCSGFEKPGLKLARGPEEAEGLAGLLPVLGVIETSFKSFNGVINIWSLLR